MINQKAIQFLFKPCIIQRRSFNDHLIGMDFPLKKLFKIDVECECSKSIDESCINTECQHNLLKIHENELYIEVLKEIQAERKEIEDRIERDKKNMDIGGDNNAY